MSEADELRQRAENLLTLALKAREQGQFELADSLLAEAAKFSNEAQALIAAQERALQQEPDSAPPSSGRT